MCLFLPPIFSPQFVSLMAAYTLFSEKVSLNRGGFHDILYMIDRCYQHNLSKVIKQIFWGTNFLLSQTAYHDNGQKMKFSFSASVFPVHWVLFMIVFFFLMTCIWKSITDEYKHTLNIDDKESKVYNWIHCTLRSSIAHAGICKSLKGSENACFHKTLTSPNKIDNLRILSCMEIQDLENGIWEFWKRKISNLNFRVANCLIPHCQEGPTVERVPL